MYNPRVGFRPDASIFRSFPALHQSDTFHMTNFEKLKTFTLETFPVEDMLKSNSVKDLWNPIFNIMEIIDNPYRDSGSLCTRQQIDC